jgi:hypothetical protein
VSTIKSSAENLTLNADGSGNDIKFQSNASEVAEITDGGVISSTGGSTHADNVKAKFGTGDDLEIYHSGSHSIIKDTGTGDLKIKTSLLNLENAAGTNNLAYFRDGGNVELYHNGSKKFETISGGSRIPSGGLLFGSDTATANALDDYEEGTWTPVFESDTVGSGRATQQNGTAHYTKIGNTVFVSGYIQLTTLGTGGGGSIMIIGFPFNSIAHYGTGMNFHYAIGFDDTIGALSAFKLQSGDTRAQINGNTGSHASNPYGANLYYANYAKVGMAMMFSGWYFTS